MKVQDTEMQFNAAQRELAKLGITLNIGFGSGGTKAEMLGERANLRRGINELSNAAREAMAKNEAERADQLTEAVEACAAIINHISNKLDMDECAREIFEGHTSNSNNSILRDRAGNRIGTLLSNDDLKDTAKIAAKIGGKESRAFDNSDLNDDNFTLGDFFKGVAGMKAPEGVRAALEEGTDAAGGYAVPTILLPGILNALVPASSLLSAGANVAVLDTQGKSFNIAAVDTIPTAAWRSEAGTLATSDPAFRSIEVTPQSLAFIFKVSRELMQDAPGLEGALRTAIAQAFAKALDLAGLRGSGTAPEIRGLLNTTGVNSLELGTADGAVLADFTPFIKARRLIADADAPLPTAAIMSTREDESVALFADTTGQPLRRPEALSSWKLLTTSQIPTDLTVGSSTDCSEIYVGDFSNFTFYMRESVSVQRLNERYADTGEIGFACHVRADVAPAYAKAFSVITGVRAAA
ncbi:MAG TPA: phage major capsid protein [Gammaproteobacteria bacterium]|nr:phage major capsid protein [Gammaproteobacteria bacterium]